VGPGKIELMVSATGVDQITAVLKKGQAEMRKLGEASEKAAQSGGKFADLRVKLEGMHGKWTDIKSQIDLVTGGLGAAFGALKGFIDFATEGEKSRNIGVVFRQLNQDADAAGEALRNAAGGTVDDTKLKSIGNRVSWYGGTWKQAADMVKISSRMQMATGIEFEQTMDRLIGAVLSGEAAEVRMSGVFIDLKKEIAEWAELNETSIEKMDKEQMVSVSLMLVKEAMGKKYREMGVDFSEMQTKHQAFNTSIENMIGNLQELAAGGMPDVIHQSKGLASAFDMDGAAVLVLRDVIKELNPQLEELAAKEVQITNELIAKNVPSRLAVKAAKEQTSATEILTRAAFFLEHRLLNVGVSMRDVNYIVGKLGPSAQQNWIAVAADLIETAEGVDLSLDRLIKKQRLALRGLAFDLSASITPAVTMLEKTGGALAALWGGAVTKTAQKKAKKSGTDRRKEELSLLEKHAQMLADNQNSLAGELHRHKIETDRIKKKSFKWAKSRNAATEIEEDRHDKALKAIESKNLSEVLSRRSREMGDQKKEEERQKKLREEHLANMQENTEKRLEKIRQRREAEEAVRQEGLQVQLDFATQLQATSQSTDDDLVAGFSTIAATTALAAKEMKNLKKGSPAAINALAQVATGAIRSEKKRAGIMAVVAQATALLELSRGNVPGYIAGQASAAAFLSIALKKGGGGKKAPKRMTGIATGGAGTTGGFRSGASSVTVNVQGFVGSTVDLSSSVQSGLSSLGEADFAAGATI